MAEPRRIVVLRSGALGDCLASTPTLRLLRRQFPIADIVLIGDSEKVGILEGCPYIDRLIPLSHRGSKISYALRLLKLRRERWDMLVDMQASGRSRVQSLVLGGKRRIGFRKGRWISDLAYTEHVAYDRSVHAVRRFLALTEPLDIDPSADDLAQEAAVDAEHRVEASILLERAHVNSEFAVLQVTTNARGDHRVWPIEAFAEVAEHLNRVGFHVVVTSLKSDEEPIRRLIEMTQCPIANISGQTHALTLAALVERARIYVGYNTGPMHLAAMARIPIVALFDVESDLVQWHPWTDSEHRIVAPPEGSGWNIGSITPRRVIEAIDDVRVCVSRG